MNKFFYIMEFLDVYLRLTPEGKKPTLLTTICTYSVSAFWHGFYPGYYIFFLTASIYTEVAKGSIKYIYII